METWEIKRKKPHLTWGASYLPVTCQGKGDISQPLIIKKIRGKTNRFFSLNIFEFFFSLIREKKNSNIFEFFFSLIREKKNSNIFKEKNLFVLPLIFLIIRGWEMSPFP